ncbi:MAG: hypothetical protein Tsb0018_06150 [Opitutales bacterium]|tara:strand:+ start:1485 stop:1844 length:360 start_codon:yes stop_codon:yes gene_type:complete
MMLLKLEIGGVVHGLEIDPIVEIIPSINTDPLESCLKGVVGSVVYRGKCVPVLDVELLKQGNHTKAVLSTRIIVVDLDGKRVAIRAEGVTDILNGEENIFNVRQVSVSDYWTDAYLSAV